MRRFGVLAALAALLGGLGGSGPGVQPSVASASISAATVAEERQTALADSGSTGAASGQSMAASPAVWRSYTWQPWTQYDGYARRWDRDRPRRSNGSWAFIPWRDDYRVARPRAWQSPQQYPWRYGRRSDQQRGTWAPDTSTMWPRTGPRTGSRNPPGSRAWRNEPWRSDLRSPWDYDQRRVNSLENSWRYR